MVYRELKKTFLSLYNKNEFNDLMYYLNKWSPTEIEIHLNDEVSKEMADHFLMVFNEMETKPLAYIIGFKFFYKDMFIVSSDVLIPRPETELIIDEIINDNFSYKNYYDICTGSGCIGLSVAKYKEIERVILSDISQEALLIAGSNKELLDISCELQQADYLKVIKDSGVKANLLTINPPYIDINDTEVSKMTLNNEPHIALFAKDMGLMFYEELFKEFENVIETKESFKVVCEFGYKQLSDIQNLFNKYELKYTLEFKKDLNNLDRYFVITK